MVPKLHVFFLTFLCPREERTTRAAGSAASAEPDAEKRHSRQQILRSICMYIWYHSEGGDASENKKCSLYPRPIKQHGRAPDWGLVGTASPDISKSAEQHRRGSGHHQINQRAKKAFWMLVPTCQ